MSGYRSPFPSDGFAGGTVADNITLGAAKTLNWSTRAALTSPADGQLQLLNAAGTNVNTNCLIIGTKDANGVALEWSAAGALTLATGALGGLGTLTTGPMNVNSGGLTFGSNLPVVWTGIGRIDGAVTDELEVVNNANNALGKLRGGTFRASADGGGTATFFSYTGTDTTGTVRSTGVGTIKFTDATARDCVGFVKVYYGTTAGFIPIFAAG